MSHRINSDIDGSSDDLKSRRGDLKSSMRTRDLFVESLGVDGGGGLGVPRGSRGASRGSHGAIRLV